MIANTPQAWSDRADEVAASYEAVRWSRAGQQERLAAVAAALDPRPDESLLDYGCGTGALCDHIPADLGYLGYDWAPGMIRRAIAEHPGRLFTATPPIGNFDLVACVGPFNLRDGWTKGETWRTLRMLWGRCRRTLAVSLYAGSDPNCLAYTHTELEAFAASSGAEGIALARPRPNDLMLVLSRTGEHLSFSPTRRAS